ncbi:protein-(glutamine-N5) methyltransferase, release factor-specific [Niveispirillum lacus]|uniref:Release factor glutamine methyltransferase n=2 Tax=Niveispirillum lacus TaxID=1981099 RepID=A0A255Z363_9PROT|nr:peptide chain release factor N(5)-glutamine methyltransferase [Niveispirillum lacus]OYQ35879.1 protein-(glutamine-N5) methyltransferase, release factor-specific [Niveispirillum lacus]
MADLAPLLRAAEERLTALGVEEARLDLLYLAERAFGITLSRLRRADGVSVPQSAIADFQALVDRRATREPVQRILGDWEFWGLTLALGPETLIPRADTETLVEAVLKRRAERHRPWRILDLGTGTGAIVLALLSEYPQAFGVGVDLSPDAAAVALHNARSLGLADRASFLAGSWADALAGPFDIIVSNPPYIPDADIAALAPEVARFEPWRALAGGVDGLDPYRHLAQALPLLLSQGGLVGFEHGADQGPAVATLLRAAGFRDVVTLCDLGGRDRVALGTHPG